MKIGVFTVTDNTAALRASIKALGGNQVLVGFPGDTADRGEPINNPTLGYIHENGAPGANIPARPFLRPGIASIQPAITERLRAAALLVLEGKPAEVNKALKAVGKMGVNAAQARLTDGPHAPLSPRTRRKRDRALAKKIRAAKTADARARLQAQLDTQLADRSPLIDTGALRRAINYVVRKR